MKMKKVGFEPTMVVPTDLQSAALNHSAISSNNYEIFFFFCLFSFFPRQPLCGFRTKFFIKQKL